MFKYSSTRPELGYCKAIEDDCVMYLLENRLFECGLDINPCSNLQRFHMVIALQAIYSPHLAN